jgi:hypothetical protein
MWSSLRKSKVKSQKSKSRKAVFVRLSASVYMQVKCGAAYEAEILLG